MRTFPRLLLLTLMSGALTPTPTALAQGVTEGRATLGGERVTLRPPLHLWDADAQLLSFAFFPDPPPPDIEAQARQFGDWLFDMPARRLILEVEFEPGQSMAMAQQVRSCRVLAIGFRTDLELMGRAADCHILSIGGLLRPGGGVVGVVQGSGKDYDLFLPFSMTLGASVPPGAAAAPATSAGPSLPMNTVTGTAEFDGQTLRPTHGLAWWDEQRGQVRVALFEGAPRPGILEELRSGSWGEGGPVVTLHFEVTRGAPPSVAAVSSCFVNVSFPRGGPIGNNTNASGCGIEEFDGVIARGGQLAVGLAGRGSGPQDKPYRWALRLHLPIAP